MFLWYSTWDVFQQGMFLLHASQENVDIPKIFGGEASYFSSCSSAKCFVILGVGSGIHRWHSCGRHISCWLLPALLFGGRPGTSTRLCPSMLWVKHGAGAVQKQRVRFLSGTRAVAPSLQTTQISLPVLHYLQFMSERHFVLKMTKSWKMKCRIFIWIKNYYSSNHLCLLDRPEYRVKSTENQPVALSSAMQREVQQHPSQFHEQRICIFCFKRGAADGMWCLPLPPWHLSLR